MEGLERLLIQLKDVAAAGRDAVLEAVIGDITSYGSKAVPALEGYSVDDSQDLRWWALRGLAEIDSPAIPAILCRALQDPVVSVRQCAVLGLQRHPSAECIADLLVCLRDADPLLSGLAGNALVAVGREAVPGLLQTMEIGQPAARLQAVKALAAIGDPRAVPALLKAIQDGDTSLVEYWADLGLERMGVGMSFFMP